MEYDIIVPTIGNDRVKQIFRVSKGDKNMLPIFLILESTPRADLRANGYHSPRLPSI